MQNFNRKLAAAFVVAAFAAPMIASADTASSSVGISADVQAQIQTLLTQIKSLQEQIKALVASSTSGGMDWTLNGSSTMGWNPGQMGKMLCVTLNRSLHQGDQGDDVKSIQELLKNDDSSGFTGNVTGFFGPLTAKAMAMFQMHNGIASSSDGTVGPRTRGFFERRCGNGEGMTNGDQSQGQNNEQHGQAQGGEHMGPGITAGSIRGTIASSNASSITVTTDTGTVTVNISASTTIKVINASTTSQTIGSIADLVVGEHVMAAGPKNSDGSIQAVIIVAGDMPSTINGMMDMARGLLGNLIPEIMGSSSEGHGGLGNGDNHGLMIPTGFMPTTKGPQQGPGTDGGPQNW